MKYKNYYNFELGNRDIYSHNDILGMTVQDLFDNELPFSYQYNTIGIPKDEELTNSPNTHQYTNANGKLRWRSSSKTTEELLEEERQRRAEQEAQAANAQSHLAGFGENSTLPGVTAPKQTLESPKLESEPLVDTNILSDFVGAAKEKWQNRKNNQTLPNTPKENIFQRLGNGIKESVEGFGEPKEVREYKRMTRDIDRASRDMQANQVSLEDLVNLPASNPEPRESFDPIQKNVVLDYPKGISASELEGLSEEELSRVGAEINSEYQKARQQALESQKRQIVGKDTDDMVLQGSVQKSNLKEHIQDSFSRFADSVNVKKKWHDFQETGFNKEDDLNLREEFLGQYEKIKQEMSKKMTPRDKIEQFLYEKALNKKYPMSSNATIDGMHDFEAAKKQKNVKVYSDMNQINNDKYKAYLKNIGANEKTPGVVYDEYSDVSAKMSNSPELDEHLVKIREQVLCGEPLDDFQLTFNASKDDFGIGNSYKDDKVDRTATFRKIKCFNPKVDENGVFTCDALDYSDFDDEEIHSLPDIPNAWGYRMVQKGLYKPYYQVVKIRKKVNW